MSFSSIATALCLISFSLQCMAQTTCSSTSSTFQCPTPDGDYCVSGSLTTNIIYRCSGGCPTAGNCNANLVGAPPVGSKTGAQCWEESAEAGNAQCTLDCVAVTALNGSSIYPLGCSFTVANSSLDASSTPTSVSLDIFASSTSSVASTTAAAPSSVVLSDTAAIERVMKGAGAVVAVVAGLLPLLL